jgi:hypothetical protein
MKDDTRELLDDILLRWHRWSAGYRAIADVGSSPMFKQCKSGRQYESQYEIAEHQLDDDAMKSVDFHVYELEPEHRTALQINARNLATGRSVWTSARLPTDLHARLVLLGAARTALAVRLVEAGIL